jgi:hypothetical protein
MILLKEEMQCSSIDFVLGNTESPEKCNELCLKYVDCHYFIYNETTKACKMEKTESPFCPEGF